MSLGWPVDDYLVLEDFIVDRLRGKLGHGVKILTATDLAGVKEASQWHPAVHVMLTGDNPNQAISDGASQKIEQQWTLVVVTRSAKNADSGAGARSIAGPLIVRAINAIQGWTPSERFKPFVRERTPYRPQNSPGGFFYFPIAFTTVFVFNIKE